LSVEQESRELELVAQTALSECTALVWPQNAQEKMGLWLLKGVLKAGTGIFATSSMGRRFVRVVALSSLASQ
jgi:hypothetical protein